jgi:hypothetical protein
MYPIVESKCNARGLSADVLQFDHGMPERKAKTSVGVAILAPMVATLLVALVTGCASAGHHFNYAAADSLELGQMRSTEYRSVFGEKPTALETRSTSDGQFEIARYTYAYADMSTTESRVLILEFKDGNLNAFQHLSSFNGDKTAAPVRDVGQIKKGVSTKDDVLRISWQTERQSKMPVTSPRFQEPLR